MEEGKNVKQWAPDPISKVYREYIFIPYTVNRKEADKKGHYCIPRRKQFLNETCLRLYIEKNF